MKPESRRILNDRNLITARQQHVERLSALFAGATPPEPFFLKGIRGQSPTNPYEAPEQFVDEALDDLAIKATAMHDKCTFHPLTIEMGPYGVHFIDHIFGADVFDLGDLAPARNWQAHYLNTPIGALHPPDLETSSAWRLAQRLASAFLQSGVTVPQFGLPTIASPLNIAVNLYGERILTALYTEPQAARHDLRLITDVLCTLHRWYLQQLPLDQLQPVVADARTQPPGFGQICGCTTALLSPGLYQDFIAPLDDELLSVYPHGGMIHLCGAHVQHIPVWRAMSSLRAVQVNDRAAEDLGTYLARLRPDQILYANPCETMPVAEILRIGDPRMVIVSERPA